MHPGDPPRARHGGEAVFLLSTVATKRGGVTRAVLARMRLLSEVGVKVRLLLTGHSYYEDREVARVRRAWSLPDSVEVRYFWREVAPGGGGAPPDAEVVSKEDEGLTPIADSGDRRTVRFYGDGLLIKSTQLDTAGHVRQVDYFDTARRRVARHQFHPAGYLVYIDEINPGTGQAALRRWFDHTGACWLTTELTATGNPSRSVRFRPTIQAYDHFGHLVAEWIEQLTHGAQATIVFADLRRHDPVLMALKQSPIRTVAVVHNGHTVEPHRTEDPLKGSYHLLLKNIDAVDAVVTLTRKQREDIAARFGGDNVKVINNPTPIHSEFSGRRDANLLVAVARLAHQKQLDHAVRAFAAASSSVPDARFDIYGTGLEESALKALIKDLDMTDRIRLRGFTHSPLKAFASAAAAVLSSRYEGFPLVLNEAMSVGTPFIAYDVNYGPAEVIRHDVDGLLVRPDDIDGLTAAMTRILSDPGYAAKLGEHSRAVRTRFSSDRWAAEWLALYADVAGVDAARSA